MVAALGKSVLIVDDEEAVREVLRRLLQQRGYEAVAVAEGREALQLASGRGFDVVLLDLRMPGLSGVDVLKQLRADHPDIGVIMVTRVAEATTAVDAMRQGAYDYVLKPFELEEIFWKVERAYGRSKLLLREKAHKREMEQRLREQEQRLKEQFSDLIQSLAQEHGLLLEVEKARGSKHRKESLAALPPELRDAKQTSQEFADTLLKLIRNGSLPRG
jgi:DNA-binding NtrC family response regulator